MCFTVKQLTLFILQFVFSGILNGCRRSLLSRPESQVGPRLCTVNLGLHCKDKMPKIWNKYSYKRNIGTSVPISTFMCLWANYIFPWWVCLFCWKIYVDWSWEYINRSKAHECGNWGWGCAIPRKGIYKRNCRCSVVRITCTNPYWTSITVPRK